MKKIVSYSLWCQKKPMDNKNYQTCNMYCNGAIKNLEISKQNNIYSDWTFRYYINNSVPNNVKNKLKELGAELIDMTGSKIPGMFWRFLPFDDKDIDVFIVRDTDSRINLREELAVKYWLDSDKNLHVMRDHPHHFYKILGGMWGYKNYKKILSIGKKMNNFLKKRNFKFKRMDDMKFLDNIYDSLDGQTLEHDAFFKYKYSQPFPNESNIPLNNYYNYVGEIFDEHCNPPNKKRDIELFKNYKKICKKVKNYR